MNPSFKAFVDPPDGFHEKPGILSNREGQLSSPEARMVVEPRMQLLGLCSFDARRKSRLLVWAPKNGGFSERLKKKKSRRKYFWGVEKVIWPPNTITRRRRKKKKKRFFRFGAEKYCSLAEKADFWFWAPKNKKAAEKQKLGGEKNLGRPKFFWGGVEKVIWPLNTITRRRRKKKKKKKFRLGAEKYDFRPPKEQRPSNFLSRPS